MLYFEKQSNPRCGVPTERAEAAFSVLQSENCSVLFADSHIQKNLPEILESGSDHSSSENTASASAESSSSEESNINPMERTKSGNPRGRDGRRILPRTKSSSNMSGSRGGPLSFFRTGVVKTGSGTDFLDERISYAGRELFTMGKKK